ncbi:Hypothetical protein CINCED_3A004660 [Cinara cedri]|uniref:Uncharacterized protein n=1 Tax=Cinara cedri TaxID=506608 RepID=A0A5E4NNT0_9HEMI|nr:Hypothetical protein CINCED_3A004660 [Cinara cedri]
MPPGDNHGGVHHHQGLEQGDNDIQDVREDHKLASVSQLRTEGIPTPPLKHEKEEHHHLDGNPFNHFYSVLITDKYN